MKTEAQLNELVSIFKFILSLIFNLILLRPLYLMFVGIDNKDSITTSYYAHLSICILIMWILIFLIIYQINNITV